MEKRFFTITEAGRVLGLSRQRVWELIQERRIAATKLSPKKWIIPQEAIDTLVAEALARTGGKQRGA